MQTDQQGSPQDRPSERDEQQPRTGSAGRGADSALKSLKQLERSRAQLRTNDDAASDNPQ
jgi:hypothetical protein